jgi:hypothetical protein
MTGRVVWVAAAACVITLAACGTASTQPFVNADVGLTNHNNSLLRLNDAPYLLVDRSDPNKVYLSNVDLQQRVCRFFYSDDGGATWREGNAPKLAPYTDCGIGTAQPQNERTELAQSSNGTLFYAFQANDDSANTSVGAPRSVLLGRSTDGGQTWNVTPIDASPTPTKPADVQVNMEVHIAVDPNNPQTVYAMWRRSYPTVTGVASRPTRPWMAVSHDGGASFGTPLMMIDQNIGFDGPRPLVASGKLYAFYRISAPPATGQATPPQTTVNVAVSTDEGKSWQQTKIDGANDASEPIALYDATRKVFDVVYHDNNVVGSASGHLNIYFTTSSDGQKWSTPMLLNDDHPGANVTQHFYPQISLASNGRLDVAWYDFRDDPYPPPVAKTPGAPLTLCGACIGHGQSVYATSSYDGGQTWTPNKRLNSVVIDRTKGTWNGEYFFVIPPTVAAGPDYTLVAWSDTRNGDSENNYQDIYAGLITYGAPANASTSNDNTPLVAAVCAVGGVLIGAGSALFAVAMATRRRSKPGVPVS